MVTTQCDQPWQCLALLGRTRLRGMSERCTGEEQVVAFLNLLECIGIVVSVQ